MFDIITSEHGSWAAEEQPSNVKFYRLDMWEDDSRRRMRFVKNEHGSSHPEATLLEVVEGKQSSETCRSLPFCLDTHELILIT